MAAGIGSRFGQGIKQLEKVDEHGHIIMDYSVHDALEAGFDKIIFIIRKDMEKEFREIIGDRIKSECNAEIEYAFQELQDIPEEVPAGRTKPWGTCHAVLAARNLIDTPFCVINADDYYGKEGFAAIHAELIKEDGDSCMAGFVLKNTLSDNGAVTRGVCNMAEGYLTKVIETREIVKTIGGAEAAGKKLDQNSLVSMNMWGLRPDFIESLKKGMEKFLKTKAVEDPLKSEFLIPNFVEELLEQEAIKVKVLTTHDIWYGMTYQEDVASVKQKFREMISSGKYDTDLYADLRA